jgi:hypothetical protein
MSPPISRRDLLGAASAALPLAAFAGSARAQGVSPAPKQTAPEDLSPSAPTAIEVSARPIPSFDLRDRARVRFGALQFRGGLQLSSRFRGFGGLSGLRLDADGERFLAISDKATWFTGRLTYSGNELTGIADVEAAPMLGADGQPITAQRRWFDSEAIARDGSLVYVALERVHQILRYDFGRGGVSARGDVLLTPPALRKLPSNAGIEALVIVPKGRPLAGTLVAISERGLDSSGNIIGFLIGGRTPGSFAVRRSDGYDISDAALLPQGDLLILERKFSWTTGVGIRIRRIALTSLAPGATIDGRPIFEADLGYEIDNLEALDAHVDAAGDTVLTMLSDDNFSMLQRTLLLQFTLLDE